MDASEHSRSALRAAAELASAFQAELVGLFVEDINLLQLADSPFAQEISFLSPGLRQLDRELLKRQLRVQADRARQELAAVASRADIPWTFRVTRGGVSAQILAAATDADLTILGKKGWSLSRSPRIGSTVQALISRGRGMTLILEQGIRLQYPVLTFYTGSQVSGKAVLVGAGLARLKNRPFRVMVLADDTPTYQRLTGDIEGTLVQAGVSAEYQRLDSRSMTEFQQILSRQGRVLVVVPSEEPYFHGTELESFLNAIDNPVLLVRPDEPESGFRAEGL
jgi:nucleotide-binding universal stress UspA family protein